MKSILLPLVFLFQFSSILLISSAHTLPVPDKYFINCGAYTNISISVDRVFTGDLNSGSVPFTTNGSSPVRDSNQVAGQTETIYQTARVFTQNSSYEFPITNTSTTYLVRLHFFAFPSTTNLSTAVFDVSTSEFSLLRNFTFRNSTTKEFLFNITSGNFHIYFVPQVSSLAFVNGIEVFPVPESFIPDTALHITSSGSNGNYYKQIVSKVLYTIHRINVGGLTLTEENDILGRNWVPDDSYLNNSDAAKNAPSYTGKPNYMGRVNEYIAPDLVYRTSKQMNIVVGSPSNNFNVTWNFRVSKNTSHFIRVHFCDTVSPSLNVLTFNLFIAGKFRKHINTYDEGNDQLAAPFYFDFVVDSDDSGILNISVGPNATSDLRTAFLNGLEIMEIMEKSVSEAPVINNGTKKGLVLVVVVSVLGGLVFIGVLAVFIFFGLKKYRMDCWSALPVFGGSTHSRVTEKSSKGKVNSAKDSKNKRNSTAAGDFNSNAPNLIVYNLTEIEVATDNLSIENKLGEGGYGPVYKGVLPDGQEIAVKKLSKTSTQGFEEFKNEVMLTAKLQHINLVRVLGFCIDREEQMLVYEYMPNKSLDHYLFDPIRRNILDWKKRVNVIEGVTQGLLYLQEYSRLTIIHRDLKASNVLLDGNMKPKISDFGMARIFTKDDLEANTGRIVGTYGYVPPEYARRGIYSTKSDVYSFGVLLLQIISGKKVSILYGENDDISLLDYAYKLWKDDKGMDFMDPSMDDTFSSCKLMTCLQIALLCVQETPNDRPTMLEVFSMLKNEATYITIPKKPAFSRLTDENEQNKSAMHLKVCSVNDATISEVVAR